MKKTNNGPKPWRLAEVNYKMLKGKKAFYKAAVLPFGATEPHNFHLPYGTDNYQVAYMADKACEYAWKKGGRVALLPGIPFGLNWNQMEFPMTMSFHASTHFKILQDVVESLEKHGVKKLLILNGHGGNSFKAIIRELSSQTSVFMASSSWFDWLPEKRAEIFEEEGEHADECETSLCMEIVPHLVDLKSADSGSTRKMRFKAMNEGWVEFPRPWHLATTNSGYGNPKKGTRQKGKKWIHALTPVLGGFLADFAKTPLSKTFPF